MRRSSSGDNDGETKVVRRESVAAVVETFESETFSLRSSGDSGEKLKNFARSKIGKFD